MFAVMGSLAKDRILIPRQSIDKRQPGGGVYYAALAAANAGYDIHAYPLLAKNAAYLLAGLQHERITTTPIWTKASTCYENTYPEQNLERCEKKIVSKAQIQTVEPDVLNRLPEYTALHLTPLSAAEFAPPLFATIRKTCKGILSIDIQGFYADQATPPSQVRQMLQNNVNIVKGSEPEIQWLAETHGVEEALKQLQDMGFQEIIATASHRGSVICVDGHLHHIAAVSVAKPVDPTGCGDAYIAGYLVYRQEGKDPLQAGQFATWLAAKNLEYSGAIEQKIAFKV